MARCVEEGPKPAEALKLTAPDLLKAGVIDDDRSRADRRRPRRSSKVQPGSSMKCSTGSQSGLGGRQRVHDCAAGEKFETDGKFRWILWMRVADTVRNVDCRAHGTTKDTDGHGELGSKAQTADGPTMIRRIPLTQDAGTLKFRITGRVDDPLSFRYEHLRRRGRVAVFRQP